MELTDVFVLKMVYSFRLVQHVPLSDSIPYSTISAAVGIQEKTLTHLFQYAMTIGFFPKVPFFQVGHSDTSRLLATNPDAFDAMGLDLNELVPATEHFPEALSKFGASQEPNETAYNVADRIDLGICDFLAVDPERARRLSSGMRSSTGIEWFNVKEMIRAFGFAYGSYDSEDFVVVDMGGEHGKASIKFAEATENMRFIVQSKRNEVEERRCLLPKGLANRVSFAEHDLFAPQTVTADMYYFRCILHQWSDKYCVEILRNLVPALKKGAAVMVYEYDMNSGDEMSFRKKGERHLDFFMMCAYNGRERSAMSWGNLFEMADARFNFQGCTYCPGDSLALAIATWYG